MNARAQPSSEQPTLPGLVLPAALPDVRARFSIWGLLHEDAHVYVQQGDVHLQVLVRQHLQLHPEARHILATYIYSDLGSVTTAEIAAHSRARRMRCATEVVVTGECLVPSLYRGKPVSLLLQVRHIALAEELLPSSSTSSSASASTGG